MNTEYFLSSLKKHFGVDLVGQLKRGTGFKLPSYSSVGSMGEVVVRDLNENTGTFSPFTCGFMEAGHIFGYYSDAENIERSIIHHIVTALRNRKGYMMFFMPDRDGGRGERERRAAYYDLCKLILEKFGFQVIDTFFNPNSKNMVEAWHLHIPPSGELMK